MEDAAWDCLNQGPWGNTETIVRQGEVSHGCPKTGRRDIAKQGWVDVEPQGDQLGTEESRVNMGLMLGCAFL